MNFISNLPLMLLSLPMVFLALSVHESAHGLAAYKLGDPTARNLGRLTLNPLKHIDILGFICMLLFHIGWAKPVPINTRNFKNPRRDMALSAAAGPASNLLTAIVLAGILRLEVWLADLFLHDEMSTAFEVLIAGGDLSMGFKCMAVLTYVIYMGVLLNISLSIFNLIPIPPFDGSRIAHVFLPAKWYFAIMRYEQYIMIALLVLLWIFPSTWLSNATGWLSSVILSIFGMRGSSEAWLNLNRMLAYVQLALII